MQIQKNHPYISHVRTQVIWEPIRHFPIQIRIADYIYARRELVPRDAIVQF